MFCQINCTTTATTEFPENDKKTFVTAKIAIPRKFHNTAARSDKSWSRIGFLVTANCRRRNSAINARKTKFQPRYIRTYFDLKPTTLESVTQKKAPQKSDTERQRWRTVGSAIYITTTFINAFCLRENIAICQADTVLYTPETSVIKTIGARGKWRRLHNGGCARYRHKF